MRAMSTDGTWTRGNGAATHIEHKPTTRDTERWSVLLPDGSESQFSGATRLEVAHSGALVVYGLDTVIGGHRVIGGYASGNWVSFGFAGPLMVMLDPFESWAMHD
jgi:hypothetical protein